MDMVQVSNMIICPHCKIKGTSKAWSHWTTTGEKNTIHSHIAFECMQCGYQIKVLDPKLKDFVVREMHWKEGDFYDDIYWDDEDDE